jgi:hypothetical protein
MTMMTATSTAARTIALLLAAFALTPSGALASGVRHTHARIRSRSHGRHAPLIRGKGYGSASSRVFPARAATVSSVQITDTGKIGILGVGVSTHSEIVTVAGPPEAEIERAERSEDPYEALGYNCIPGNSSHPDLSRIELIFFPPTEEDISGVPTQACLTVFYIDESKRTLAAFATTSSSYRESNGLRVGIATRAADRRTHARATGGCIDALRLRTRQASLTALIDGSKDVARRHDGNTELLAKGGHVSEIVITAATDELGLFDCIDS